MSENLDYSEGTLRTAHEADEVITELMAKILPPVVKLPLMTPEE